MIDSFRADRCYKNNLKTSKTPNLDNLIKKYEKQNEQEFKRIDDDEVIEAYAVFGLNHNATLEQIKSKFREFALKYHPDKNKSPTSTAMMVKINYSYKVIIQWWKNHD